jgi:tRNA-dihydrouridine synthase 2
MVYNVKGHIRTNHNTLDHAMQTLLRSVKSTMTSSNGSSMSSSLKRSFNEFSSTSTLQTPRVPIPRNGVDYRGKVVLAPMVRSGELPSRLLALQYGADLVWGPETVDRSMIGTTRKINPRTSCIEWTRPPSNVPLELMGVKKDSIIFKIDPTREKGKMIYQIGTSDPDRAVQVGKLVAADVSGIDVNAGCPKPFSTSGGMGAALLRTPDHLASILRALVDQVGKVYEIGISVKIRLLETPELTESLVRKLCATGITGLTVHCRTTPMRPRERAIRDQLRMIGSICREEGVACLMNGDVANRDEAIQLADQYGVDGAMIATAAEKNSSVFRSAEQGGLDPWRVVVKEYLKLAMSVENKWINTKFMLGQLIPGKEACYETMSRSRCYVECLGILPIDGDGDGDGDLLQKARAADNALGLDEPMPTRQERKQKRKQLKRALQEESTGKEADDPPHLVGRVRRQRQARNSQNNERDQDVAFETLQQATPV